MVSILQGHVYATLLFPYVELIYAQYFGIPEPTRLNCAIARLLRFQRGAVSVRMWWTLTGAILRKKIETYVDNDV